MKALFHYVFTRLLKRNNSKPQPAVTSPTEDTIDFTRLSTGDQETVRQYFYAAARVMQLVEGIRRQHRAFDVGELLTAYQKTERAYIWAGFRPFFPPAIQRMREFTPAELAESRLLNRIADGEKAAVYSATMNRHVYKLIGQFRAEVLESSDFEHLFQK